MSAASLSAALHAAGIPCLVEALDGLAVITPDSAHGFAEPDVRRRVLAIAREHGFTHAAVELAATTSSATLRRD